MRLAHLIALVLMNVLWAGSYSAFKALSDTLSAGEIVTWRFTMVAVILAVVWRWLPGRGPRGGDLFRALIVGVLVFG